MQSIKLIVSLLLARDVPRRGYSHIKAVQVYAAIKAPFFELYLL